MQDWLPGYRTEQCNNAGLVTWLPNRATQQCRTGYLATEQCKPNNRKRFYLVGLEPTVKGDTKRLEELTGAETVRRVLAELAGYVATGRLLGVLLFTGARSMRRALR
jgi:hypothetical protein